MYAKLWCYLNLNQGYILGNPVTDLHNNENSRVEFFFRADIDKTIWGNFSSANIKLSSYNSFLLCKLTMKTCESQFMLLQDAKEYWNGDFIALNATNVECIDTIQRIAEVIMFLG